MMDGAELRRRRLALGLKQAELAERLDVSENTVARWERGERNIAHPTWLDAILERLEAPARKRRPRGRSVPATPPDSTAP